jgi:plastocyanin
MRRSATLLAALLLVLGALAVAGCGGDDNSSSQEAKTSNEQPAAGAGPEASGGSQSAEGTVAIKAVDIKFKPEQATAKVGQKVTWTNDDQIAHTVTAKDGPEKFDSGTLEGGDTFSFTPKKAGSYPYVCLIHPSQTGTLTVSE